MAKTYERINWENLPSKNTPINAENLNKMDEAIDKLDDKIVELEENGGSGGSSGDYLEKENPVGTGSFSMNRKANTTVGNCSHAEGYDTTASGLYSHAEGYNTTASGGHSHAEGNNTTASGGHSHAEGNNTTASGGHSHAEGSKTTAKGNFSHAEGGHTTASETYSHAEGYDTIASGNCSHAEGSTTIASGGYSHAEGYETIASGYYSHAEGKGTIASGTYQHVQGKYNVEDTKNEFAHIVGGGTSDTDRKNIHTLDWQGNAVFAGDVINGNGVTMDELKAQIEGMGGGTALDAHMNDTVVHITSEERTNWNDANSKKHTHSNKSVLDGITSTLITAWNSAVTHITDAVKHITATERTAWNAKLGTEKIAANLTTTEAGMLLDATMGKQLAETDASLQEQISTLNSNMPIFIKDKHTVSLDATCDEALYTLYTAEKPCFVSFTSLVYWINVRPTSITLAINTNDNLYSSKVFKTTENLNNHVHLSGCAYLNRGERISVYATAESAGIDDIYTTLMINYV